jgi:CheY-like chemotaxis protein
VIETVTFDLPYLLKEIEETYVLLAQDKALGFSIQLDSPIPQRITSDPLRLKQILTNLLNNAIRYTKEGNVKTSVRYTPDNQTLLFKVIDTGPGLELLAQKQIFNAFHQTSSNTTSEHQGAGLGLFICKSLSALLGGSIDVTSKIGEGSQFTFSIQCQQPSGQCDNLDNVPLAQPTTYDVPRLKGNILLVEDTLINQELFTHNIEVTGASVVIAQNGQQGLQEVLENDYSLVLMDIQMPVMDGKQAIKAMRQLGCNLPVYALTANVNSTDIAEYKALGFDGILAKPLEMEQFYHALEQCLAGPNEHAKEKPKPSDGLVHLRQQFLQDLCEQRYQLEHFLAQNSLSEVSKIVHVIKGVAGGFGFNALTEQAQHCLLSLRTGHDEQAVVLTKSLCDHIEMLLKQEQEHDEAH